MNTPTHLVISHAIIGSKVKKLTSRENWAVFLGTFLPDAAIYVLFFYALIAGIPQSSVWGELYFSPFWTNLVDYFNSIPITTVLIALGLFKSWRWLWLYGASSMLHIIADFFTHSGDAHQHFLPLSTWRFESPVSYYEPDKYGIWVSFIEIGIVLISTYYIQKQIKSPIWRKLFLGISILWLILSTSVTIFFLLGNGPDFGNN